MLRQNQTVYLVGASCRAAAECLVANGWKVQAWDLYADRDTMALCECHRIDSFSTDQLTGLLEAERAFLLPCGGLENHPEVWTALAKKHQLLGPDTDTLRRFRDVFWLHDFFSRAGTGLTMPLTVPERPPHEILSRHKWLCKPFKSAGGLGIRRADHSTAFDSESEYFQQAVDGTEYGTIFLCNREDAKLIGAIAKGFAPAVGGKPFVYTGSMGPVRLTSIDTILLETSVGLLARTTKYAGVIQADIIRVPDGSFRLLEINPRWTAGMELPETAVPGSVVNAFFANAGVSSPLGNATSASSTRWAKQIVYAENDVTISQNQSDQWLNRRGWYQVDSEIWIRYADIPFAGTQIPKSNPVCTVLVRIEDSVSEQSLIEFGQRISNSTLIAPFTTFSIC